MPADRSAEELLDLLTELRALPAETGWVEFKVDNVKPDEIGKRLSGLANTAAIDGQAFGYLVWGVEDQTHRVVGTSFRPATAKKGNEDLGPWLARGLDPSPHLRFHELATADGPVVILSAPRASQQPVTFDGEAYVRVGSYTKRLSEHPELARVLWRSFDAAPFEIGVAAERLASDDVLARLDYPTFFRLLGLPLPDNRDGILDRLMAEAMIAPAGGRWNVTNLGAILFAQDLDAFPRLRRKALRVVQYEGDDKLQTLRERVEPRGYAVAFEAVIDFIKTLTPARETIGAAFRKTEERFPELAVRELVPNALIHQDFAATGSGPMVELFDTRLEVSNPGVPLFPPPRFLDNFKSRNETLAAFMRRINLCEERGSGVDKVVSLTERLQLPAPLFEAKLGATQATLFAARPFAEMDREDRVRACYLHACLRYIGRRRMTNSSLRDRFGLPKTARTQVTEVLKAAVAAGDIKPADPDNKSKRHASYVPGWA